MSYPGTKVRERTALESSLVERVAELERERDELVEALRTLVTDCENKWGDPHTLRHARNALDKYPCSDTQAQFNDAAARS